MTFRFNPNEYLAEDSTLPNFIPDQTVIIKKRFLHHVPSINYAEPPIDPCKTEDCYPLVNSYYRCTEDVDAYARVNHLIGTKPSFASLSSVLSEDLTTDNQLYSEKDTQIHYLQSSPPCFFIISKSGVGSEELGRHLANYWKCIYIDPQTLIEEAIGSETRSGQCIEFNLRCGRAIGIDVILRLLAKKVQTAQCRHRGFVLCGFPLIQNDLYEEDPISSESAVFTAREIFEEIAEGIEDHDDEINVSYGSITDSLLPSSSEIMKPSAADLGLFSIPSIGRSYYFESNTCVQAEIITDSEKQLHCLFGIFSEPFLITYITCPNAEVIAKRNDYLFNIYSGKTVDFQKLNMFWQIGAENGDLVRDLFDPPNSSYIADNLQHLVRVPCNFPVNVATELDRFHNVITNQLDQRLMLHDPDYFLKLDGRSMISAMFDALKMRLKVLPLQRVVLPERLNVTTVEEPGEVEGEDSREPKEFEHLTVEEAFKKYSKRNLVSPNFKWNWSDWKTYCPISMAEGFYLEGNPEFAVHFMNKLFFLNSNEALEKFMDDPRTCLLPPFPKMNGKIFILGPPCSGKTAVAKTLGYFLNSEVLDPKTLYDKYLNDKGNEHKELCRQNALLEGVRLLNQERKREYLEKVEVKNDLIDEWLKNTEEALVRILYQFFDQKSELGVSSFPVKLEKTHSGDLEAANAELTLLNLPLTLDQEFCTALLENQTLRLEYLPKELQEVVPPPIPATVMDDFVKEHADTVSQEFIFEETELTDQDICEMFINAIQKIESQSIHLGWIVDGIQINFELLKKICEIIRPNIVIFLEDDPESRFLADRIKIKFKNQYRDFKHFFVRAKELNASLRCPSTKTTSTFKNQIVIKVIDDILDKIGVEEIESEPEFILKYHTELRKYSSEIGKIKDYFRQFLVEVVEISVTGRSLENLMEDALRIVQDKFRLGATEYTEAERAEEVQMFLAQQITEGEGERHDEDWQNSFEESRCYGDTKVYCPVMFHNNWVLWKGKDQFTVRFDNKLYLLSSEIAMRDFLTTPRKYLDLVRAPNSFPPPRVCVIGPHGSGKTTISTILAKNLGVRCFNYKSLVKDKLDSLTDSFISTDFEQYLNANQPLPDEMLELIVDLWYTKPVKFSGFVLDDFPKRPCDVSVMVSKKLIPDSIIYVAVGEGNNIERLLAKSIAKWRRANQEQREIENYRRQKIINEWEENRKWRYKALMEIKRQEQYSMKIEDNIEPKPDQSDFLSTTQVSFDSIAEDVADVEVLRTIDYEFPEPQFSDHFESETEAIERLKITLETNFQDELNYYEEIHKLCEQNLIPWQEIDGNRGIEKVVLQSFIATNHIKSRNKSFFESCLQVSVETAEKLLETGYYFLSVFGKTCPVQYYEHHISVQMYIPSEIKSQLFPVLHRQFVYFLAGVKGRDKFLQDPLKYVYPKKFRFPLIPFRISVIGPPKSGKTRLSNRFRHQFGFKVLTRGQAVRYILKSLPCCQLSQDVERRLRKGEELTDEMVLNCVYASSFDGFSVTQGLVFDGFPNSSKEISLMSSLNLVPNLILDLRATDRDVEKFKKIAPIHEGLPVYSERFTRHLLEEFRKTAEKFRSWCDREYQNIYRVGVKQSAWGVWEESQKVALATFSEIQHYFINAHSDWPLLVGHMLITPLEFLQRQSCYKNYCPVCLKLTKGLKCGGNPPDRTTLIHFRQHLYWICKDHIDLFLKSPEPFLLPYNAVLPQDLPQRVETIPTDNTENVEELCLVCYSEQAPNRVLKSGSINYAITFKSKLFLFDSEHCLNMFTSTPGKYINTPIYFRQTHLYDEDNFNVQHLPVLGFLEQMVTKQLVKAINHIGIYRPVIAGLSVSVSALIGIGLHLKANNLKATKESQLRYGRALELFHERRKSLITSVERIKTVLNPYSSYVEPNMLSSEDDEDSSSDSSVITSDDVRACVKGIIDDILDVIR